MQNAQMAVGGWVTRLINYARFNLMQGTTNIFLIVLIGTGVVLALACLFLFTFVLGFAGRTLQAFAWMVAGIIGLLVMRQMDLSLAFLWQAP